MESEEIRRHRGSQSSLLDRGGFKNGGPWSNLQGNPPRYFRCRKQKAVHNGDAAANPSDFSSGSNSSTKSEPIQTDGGDDGYYAVHKSTSESHARHQSDCWSHPHSASDLDDVECAMTARLSHLRRTWDAALRESVLDGDAAAAIMSFHFSSRSRPAAVDREVFTRHLGSLFEVYKNHARMQPEFQAMSETEQRDVLRRNGPLFLQYILSGYFGASSSEEQLDWIFLKQGGIQ